MRPDKASRRARITRAINRQRVILALHMATVGDGPIVTASDAELGRLAGGMSPATVRKHLEALHLDDCSISIFDPSWCDAGRRTIVLHDHPSGQTAIMSLCHAWDVPYARPRAPETAPQWH